MYGTIPQSQYKPMERLRPYLVHAASFHPPLLGRFTSYGTKNVERFDPEAQLQTQLNRCDMVSWLCCQEPKRELTQQWKLFDMDQNVEDTHST